MGLSIGCRRSPLPLPIAHGDMRKKGTSEPRSEAIATNSLRGNFKFHKILRASRAPAAFPLPPPSPAPEGIFFLV